MMRFVWFCASGYSFFLGVALLLFAIFLFASNYKKWFKTTAHVLAILSMFLILLSATPLPRWFFSIWAIAILTSFLKFSTRKTLTTFLRIIAVTISIIALLLEIPYHLTPSFPNRTFERMYIIGDSVAAGIGGEQEQTWPEILQKDYGIDVVDFSRAGATVGSAISQAAQIDSANAIVLLEIGGNDLFAPTPSAVFEKELDQLIRTVSHPNQLVVMLELPLQPWDSQYGRIQRRLANESNTILIPKRFFVSVLSTPDTTYDLAHLSAKGHRLMAETIWSLIGQSMDIPGKKE